MKLLTALLTLLISPTIQAKNSVILPHEYSVSKNLNNQIIWKMADHTLRFQQDDGKCELKDEQDKAIHTWESPMEVTGAVASDNGKVLLVRIMTAKGFYHGLARFILKDNKWIIDEVMLRTHPDMIIRDRWIQELGAVSDDSATAILHLGEADIDLLPAPQSFRMFYTWQTWNLNSTKKLGTGLKMCNGKRESSDMNINLAPLLALAFTSLATQAEPTFDLKPGFYSLDNPAWKKLSDFQQRADVHIRLSEHAGISLGDRDNLTMAQLQEAMMKSKVKNIAVILLEKNYLDETLHLKVEKALLHLGFQQVLIVSARGFGTEIVKFTKRAEHAKLDALPK